MVGRCVDALLTREKRGFCYWLGDSGERCNGV